MFLLGIIGGSLLTYGILKANKASKVRSIERILDLYYGVQLNRTNRFVANKISKRVL